MTSQSQRSDTWASGITVFAGVLLATLGVFQILEGIAAVLEDDVFVRGINYVYEIDVTAWGWIHILIGAAGLLVGFGLVNGRRWAMIAGLAFVVVSMVSNFMFLPYYPFWAVLIIALNAVVLWAIAKQLGEG